MALTNNHMHLNTAFCNCKKIFIFVISYFTRVKIHNYANKKVQSQEYLYTLCFYIAIHFNQITCLQLNNDFPMRHYKLSRLFCDMPNSFLKRADEIAF